MCQRNPQLDFQVNWDGVSSSMSASVQYTAVASSARKHESVSARKEICSESRREASKC